MQDKLHIDIETYSSVDIKTSGIYKYAESLDFEILIVCYKLNDNPIQRIALALGEELPQEFITYLFDKNTLKLAHNAMFERVCLGAVGYKIPPEQWECTSVKALYCGLPASLEQVSMALKLGDDGKSAEGKKLIAFFSVPQRGGKRNMPKDYPEKFEEFIDYCVQDVVAECKIDEVLGEHEVCDFERNNYFLDQHINDHGIKVDLAFAQAAYELDLGFKEICIGRLKELTGLTNPNSPKQLIDWLNLAQDKITISSVAKENPQYLELTKNASGAVSEVLKLREAISKTSVKKFTAMLCAACEDDYIRGCFQFYGANKTGRFAGRIVQFQNLPINKYLKHNDKVDTIDLARDIIARNDLELAIMIYGNKIPNVLSEMIRPALIASDGKTFDVSDFSAIEARILSWLAAEEWRMEVFATHGKIYEAAAVQMFNVPIELVTKDSDYRMRAKNGELALGYGGSLGAMQRMAGPKTTLTESDMKDIVRIWRKVNPKIVRCWNDFNNAAIESVVDKCKVEPGYRGVSFEFDGKTMRMNLPSGRSISYYDAKLKKGKFDGPAIAYKNIDQKTKKWWDTDTYGGKLVENAVQAISRDVLVYSMQNLHTAGFEICIHVHDEVVCEVDETIADSELVRMENIMKQNIPWAPDLILGAAGYTTKYYKKD